MTQYGPTIVPAPSLRLCIDNRGRMNLHVAHLSRNVNINSPSETTASFTMQQQLALAMRSPRALVSSGVNEKRVAGKNRFAEFHAVRAHEITDAARALRECA